MPRDVRHYPGLRLFAVLFFLFLYLPIAVVIVASFNEDRLATNWTGFSLRWYAQALQNDGLIDALKVSLTVAAVATAVATTVAVMAALVLVRGRGVRMRQLSEVVVNLPLVLPEIVLAVALLILFSQIGLDNGLLRLIVAHSAFCIPFAFLPIRARLQGMDMDVEEAAQDLYASPWVTFRRVTLPMIAPGVASGAMLAFVISMDDFITSSLLNTGGATTLPVFIFSLVRQGTTPELNAISTLVTLASLAIATVALALTYRSPKPA